MGTGAARDLVLLCKMVLQEYQHDNHGMSVTNMFQTSWSGAAKVPHMFRNFMGTGAARVPA